MSEQEIQKLYYSIGEVSEKTGVEQHVLRYWETVYKELSPRKSRSGKRLYLLQDIEIVQHIKTLLYKDGYKSRGAQERLRELLKTEQPQSIKEPEYALTKQSLVKEENSALDMNDIHVGLLEIRRILDD